MIQSTASFIYALEEGTRTIKSQYAGGILLQPVQKLVATLIFARPPQGQKCKRVPSGVPNKQEGYPDGYPSYLFGATRRKGLERAAPVRRLVQKLRTGEQFLARGRVHRRKTHPVKDVGFLLFLFAGVSRMSVAGDFVAVLHCKTVVLNFLLGADPTVCSHFTVYDDLR